MKDGLLKQVKDNVEIPEVEKLCKEGESLVIDEDGILCHTLLAIDARKPTQTL